MNKIMYRGVRSLSILLLVAVFVSACSNPFAEKSDSKEPKGAGIEVKIIIPDYDTHLASSASVARVISPESRWVRILLDGDLYMEAPLEEADITEGRDGNTTTFVAEFWGVPAKEYREIKFDLLDESGGTVLTTGSAFNVEILEGVLNPVSAVCFVKNYESLSVNSDALQVSIVSGEMHYFKFFAEKEANYTLTITPASGSPDLYLYAPDGRSAKDALAEPLSVYTAGALGVLSFTATMSGRYAVGVYGFSSDAVFSLALTSANEVMDPAQTKVDAAFGRLYQKDWSGALDNFAEAALQSPGNPRASLGFAALTILNTAARPEVVDFARGNLGLVDYPATLSEVLDVDWLQETINVYWEYDEQTGTEREYEDLMYLPRIQGEDELDGVFGEDNEDGVIDISERAMAFFKHYAYNNLGIGGITHIASDVLGSQLEVAIRALEYVDDDARFTITWDMLYDSLGEAVNAGWPQMPAEGGGTVNMELVIGKAELLAVASVLDSVRSLAYLGGVYTLEFSTLTQNNDGSPSSLLIDFYRYFKPDGLYQNYGSFPSRSPLEYWAFLNPSEAAMTYLTQSKLALVNMLENQAKASDLMADRLLDDDFTLPQMIAEGDEMAWADFANTIFPFASMTLSKAAVAVEENGTLYIPMDVVGPDSEPALDVINSYLSGTTSWPAPVLGVEPENALAVQPGVAFNAVPRLRELAHLRSDGEPVFYGWDFETPFSNVTFSPLTLTELGLVVPISEYPASMPGYFMKIDASLGGIVPDSIVSELVDDPSTRIKLHMGWFDEYYGDDDDRTSNDTWDVGENLERLEFVLDMNGPIDLARLDEYGDLDAYIDLSTLTRADVLTALDQSGSDIYEAVSRYVDLDDPLIVDEFRIALEATETWNSSQYHVEVSFDDDGVKASQFYLDGNTLYLPTPSHVVWNSVTRSGDSYYESDTGTTWKSCGSMWYVLMGGGQPPDDYDD